MPKYNYFLSRISSISASPLAFMHSLHPYPLHVINQEILTLLKKFLLLLKSTLLFAHLSFLVTLSRVSYSLNDNVASFYGMRIVITLWALVLEIDQCFLEIELLCSKLRRWGWSTWIINFKIAIIISLSHFQFIEDIYILDFSFLQVFVTVMPSVFVGRTIY